MPLTIAGLAASSTNPDTWSDYQAAIDSKIGDGPGFVLNGDGIVCIDLDHCYNGELAPEAQAILDQLPETYVEISPSGTGIHIWGFANLEKGRRFSRNGQSVEIYPSGRYITITGQALSQARFANLELTNLMP